MSFVDSLMEQIEDLSSNVESKLQTGNEECCPELLNTRQLLLEKLATAIDVSNLKVITKYREFLLSIQTRDNASKSSIIEQQKLLLSQSNHQSKAKKAINAYNKFG